ncbi:MAG: RNA polymerase sigma factor [Calditrichaeota bacterium]|nr:MAG: RNA polymerase sigma factor [Calditrichota bacterium]
MNDEERALIREAQRGNALAFETLIRRYDQQVLQLAYSMVKNMQDAEDIYQEVFVRVFKNLSRFHFRSEFSTWLYRVVVNHCLNFQRRQKRRRMFSLQRNGKSDFDAFSAQIDGSGKNPEENVLNSELSAEIETAIEQLSPRQKMVFLLRHYHGHKLKDIAEMMNCSEGAVKNYLFRATRKMQTLLRAYSNPEGSQS